MAADAAILIPVKRVTVGDSSVGQSQLVPGAIYFWDVEIRNRDQVNVETKGVGVKKLVGQVTAAGRTEAHHSPTTAAGIGTRASAKDPVYRGHSVARLFVRAELETVDRRTRSDLAVTDGKSKVDGPSVDDAVD